MNASIVSNVSSPTADAAARVWLADSVVLTRRRLSARRSCSSSHAESVGTIAKHGWFGRWREAARVRFS